MNEASPELKNTIHNSNQTPAPEGTSRTAKRDSKLDDHKMVASLNAMFEAMIAANAAAAEAGTVKVGRRGSLASAAEGEKQGVQALQARVREGKNVDGEKNRADTEKKVEEKADDWNPRPGKGKEEAVVKEVPAEGPQEIGSGGGNAEDDEDVEILTVPVVPPVEITRTQTSDFAKGLPTNHPAIMKKVAEDAVSRTLTRKSAVEREGVSIETSVGDETAVSSIAFEEGATGLVENMDPKKVVDEGTGEGNLESGDNGPSPRHRPPDDPERDENLINAGDAGDISISSAESPEILEGDWTPPSDDLPKMPSHSTPLKDNSPDVSPSVIPIAAEPQTI
ncbi:hypothetical protein HK104_009928, partial [Borealophlyctis nickersoniae]